MTAKLLVLLAGLCCVVTSLSSVDGDHFPPSRIKRCLRHRSYGKVASDCGGRDFHSVPNNLNTDIQVLDLSYNRIREVNRDSFSKYTNLELLFLDDNMITYIANDTFQPLQYLEVLLLNLNSLRQVPTSLFSLPYLRKVDLAENSLLPGGFPIFAEAPVTNQLKWLSLASGYLNQLPPLHRFPLLEFLNVSNNPLKSLDALELAPLCSLKQLDLGASSSRLSPCDCQLLVQWARSDGISIYPSETLDCPQSKGVDKKQCRTTNHTLEAQELRNQCVQIVAEQLKQEHMTKEMTSVDGIATTTSAGTTEMEVS